MLQLITHSKTEWAQKQILPSMHMVIHIEILHWRQPIKENPYLFFSSIQITFSLRTDTNVCEYLELNRKENNVYFRDSSCIHT